MGGGVKAERSSHVSLPMARQKGDERYNRAISAIYVSVFGNGLLFAVKVALGLYIGSVAVVADAFHSLSDMGTTLILFLGFYISTRPEDQEHPYGHGRAEQIAGIVLASLLMVIGFEIIIRASGTLLSGQHALIKERINMWTIAIIVLTIIVKEAMARYTHTISHAIKSDAMEADAWHHRSDALSSVGVLIGLVGGYFGMYYLDSVIALGIGVLIIYVGIRVGLECSNTLMGRCPTPSEIDTIRGIVSPYRGVSDVHEIEIHDYGSTMVVTLHVRVDASMSVEESHRIASEIEGAISSRLGASVTVHVEPDMDKN